MRALLISLALTAPIVLVGCLTPEGDVGSDEVLDDSVVTSGERGGDERGGPKVDICHIPPGNPGAAHTIRVSPSAVPAHLAHGDYRGACLPDHCGDPQICTPNETWTCYTAPLSTDGIGACQRGVKTCNATGTAWGACVGEVTPVAEVCGNGIDDDCDGSTDEGCTTCVPTAEVCGDHVDNDCDGSTDEGCGNVCPPGEEWTCYTAPLSTDGIGACHRGVKTCLPDGSGYGSCVGEVTPSPEVCGNGIDDDCDGSTDEGCSTCVPAPEVCGDHIDNDCDTMIDETCACSPGSTIGCYGGPAGTAGVGTCHAGTQTCNPAGSGYGACVGDVTPVFDACGDGLDNDCDGVVDDGCVCSPGSADLCYDGPAGTMGVGVCTGGVKLCNATGTGYGACVGAVGPSAEVCGDGLDNDCDGTADEGCVCAPSSAASCYDGPAGTEGVGTCQAGTMTCNATGTGYGACVGSVGPAAEVCGDGLDNDCDGVADDGCVCTPGSTALCYDGPVGTDGVGACSPGVMECNATGTGYGACVGAITPTAETCGDAVDNDCDASTDETCACPPSSVAACYEGPAGTQGVGVCVAGGMTCAPDGSGYGACVGAVYPSPEVCGDGLDNDCDGASEEGCVCAPLSVAECYDGPAGTEGVGICRAGSQTCNGTGTGYGACVGSVTPVAEVCGNGLDDDCDGRADEGCLGDRAWNDRDVDGVQDPGEGGYAGATFLLRLASTGGLVQVAVSDATGHYMFSNVPAGNYYIEVIPPASTTITPMDATGDTLDSDFDGETASTPIFSYSGAADYTWDCGLAFSISG